MLRSRKTITPCGKGQGDHVHRQSLADGTVLFRARDNSAQLRHAALVRRRVDMTDTNRFTYGFSDGNLLILPHWFAVEMARTRIALYVAANWGTFYALVPASKRKDLREGEMDTSGHNAWADFLKEARAENPGVPYAQVMRQHRKLKPYYERPALPEDVFRGCQALPHFEDGVWPEFPCEAMPDLLPKSIRTKYGKLIVTVHDGLQLTLNPSALPAIVEDLTATGATVENNDPLLRVADDNFRACSIEQFLIVCREVLPAAYADLVDQRVKQSRSATMWLRARRNQLGVALPPWAFAAIKGTVDLQRMVICRECHRLGGRWKFMEPPHAAISEEEVRLPEYPFWQRCCSKRSGDGDPQWYWHGRDPGRGVVRLCHCCAAALIRPGGKFKQNWLCEECRDGLAGARLSWEALRDFNALILHEHACSVGLAADEDMPLRDYIEKIGTRVIRKERFVARLREFAGMHPTVPVGYC